MNIDELTTKITAIAYAEIPYTQQINEGLDVVQAYKDAGGTKENSFEAMHSMLDHKAGTEPEAYAIMGILNFADRFCFPAKPTWDTEEVRRTVREKIAEARSTNVTQLLLDTFGLGDELPEELFEYSELDFLGLGRNLINSLTGRIGLLCNLQVLNLYSNRLTGLPPEFVNLRKLKSLQLGFNVLVEIPLEVFELTTLDWLNLRDNRIDVLPPEIGQLTNLRELHLYNNNIRNLPTELRKLAHLETLDLRENPLPIPVEILREVDNPQRILNYYFREGLN